MEFQLPSLMNWFINVFTIPFHLFLLSIGLILLLLIEFDSLLLLFDSVALTVLFDTVW